MSVIWWIILAFTLLSLGTFIAALCRIVSEAEHLWQRIAEASKPKTLHWKVTATLPPNKSTQEAS